MCSKEARAHLPEEIFNLKCLFATQCRPNTVRWIGLLGKVRDADTNMFGSFYLAQTLPSWPPYARSAVWYQTLWPAVAQAPTATGSPDLPSTVKSLERKVLQGNAPTLYRWHVLIGQYKCVTLILRKSLNLFIKCKYFSAAATTRHASSSDSVHLFCNAYALLVQYLHMYNLYTY